MHTYLGIYFGAVFFFMAVYHSWKFLFESVLKDKTYLSKNHKERCFFLSCWGANTHHIMCVVLATYNFMNPRCENTKSFSWFTDEACMVTMDKRHVYIAAFTGGYLIYDGLVLILYVGASDALAWQTFFHHVIGTSGLFVGVMAGYGAPGIANLSVLSEFSTIFLNYRSMFNDHTALLPQINQVCFFFAYTIFRMVLFPYGTYVMIMTQYYAWNYSDDARRIYLSIAIIEYIMMFALNVYWYKLIIVGMLKLFGVIEVKPKDKKVDEGQ